MHLVILELVSLREASGEVDHGLYWHPAFDGLVASVELGHGFLDQSDPELVLVGAPGVAVISVSLWQSVINENGFPTAVAPNVDSNETCVALADQNLWV